ncbi:N-acetylmuramoyl-L-alanine amidase family protein [Candidatus Endolissoclinum faulkneri]|uniref:N-acetylmuramoyl-L-alanine amidase family protein n=1 Tax=Candidatus Endolissoclinum faulkneri TaxID=1263979 RepID=UPI0013150342|nr:N-acetylmuramoyl-L-alanine amidase [Candidatus Endolissoclinum faulkneri]
MQYILYLNLIRITKNTILKKSNLKPSTLSISPDYKLTKDLSYRPKSKNQLKIIILDPGHGGRDPGAIGYKGIYEKDILLNTAKELKKLLEKTGNYKAVLTRNKDYFIALGKRIAISQQENADLFISLHANSVNNQSLRGLSVYTLSDIKSSNNFKKTTIKPNKIYATLQNGGCKNKLKVSYILLNLKYDRVINCSARLAGYIIKEMKRKTKLLTRPHRFANFTVLKVLNIPSVLIELGFLSNQEDNQLLSNPAYLHKIAAALALAIDNYLSA